MARPTKTGLAYFPKDVDYYQDGKIIDLMLAYGPLGLVTYDVILTAVYRSGYYIESAPSKLAKQIVHTVGAVWYRRSGTSAIDLATEIIHYCAEIGLLNASFVKANVITSVGIQRRYAEVTVRNKADKSKYWLLGKDGNPIALESMPENRVSVTETGVSAAKTMVSVTKTPQRKVKKSKENESKSKKKTALRVIVPLHGRAFRYRVVRKVDFVIEEYERLLPLLPPAKVTEKLNKHLSSVHKPLSEYTRLFETAVESTFLMKTKTNWQCDIEWLTEPNNMEKVLSGNYSDFKKPVRRSETPLKQEVINGVESGFETDSFFEAALRRSWKEK